MSGFVPAIAALQFFNSWLISHRTDMPHFVYPSVDRRLGCFRFLAVTDDAPVNVCVQAFVQTYVYTRGWNC